MKTDTVKGIKIKVIGMNQASDQICFHLGAPKPFSGGDHGVIHIAKPHWHLGARSYAECVTQTSSFHLLNELKRQCWPLNFKGDAQSHTACPWESRAGIQVYFRLHSELLNPRPCAYLPDHVVLEASHSPEELDPWRGGNDRSKTVAMVLERLSKLVPGDPEPHETKASL